MYDSDLIRTGNLPHQLNKANKVLWMRTTRHRVSIGPEVASAVRESLKGGNREGLCEIRRGVHRSYLEGTLPQNY
jgi:hypothetical protein